MRLTFFRGETRDGLGIRPIRRIFGNSTPGKKRSPRRRSGRNVHVIEGEFRVGERLAAGMARLLKTPTNWRSRRAPARSSLSILMNNMTTIRMLKASSSPIRPLADGGSAGAGDAQASSIFQSQSLCSDQTKTNKERKTHGSNTGFDCQDNRSRSRRFVDGSGWEEV